MSDTVLVACKVSNGVILRLMAKKDAIEPVLGGGMRSVTKWEPTGEQIELKGPAVPFGQIPRKMLYSGYGFTQVPRSFWETWVTQNKDSSLLESRVVFAANKEDYLRDRVDEQDEEGVYSGLEPLDPKINPVTGRPLDRRLQGQDLRRMKVETADEQAPMLRTEPEQPQRPTAKRNGRVRRA